MTGKLVIAVDVVRRGRSGPYVAAAIAYRENATEPLFRYTDGRGALCEEYLFRQPEKIKQRQSPGIRHYLNKTTVAITPYRLPPEKAPRDSTVARLMAMLFAVKKLAERLKHCCGADLEGLDYDDLHLVVAGEHRIETRQFAKIRQTVAGPGNDWRTQAAKYIAHNSFA